MPPPEARNASLGAVLHVLYLIFNEGYATSSGRAHQRVDLSSEAIRLARAAHELVPESSEASGLLALMLLTDARRAARSGPDGEIVPLDEQDRSLWSKEAIAEGVQLVTEAMMRGRRARISCRPPLRRCTTKRRAPKTRTGRGSSRSTAC
jgi:predicted RNA polymerase sigma factor